VLNECNHVMINMNIHERGPTIAQID
jgi:hypothetical protein